MDEEMTKILHIHKWILFGGHQDELFQHKSKVTMS